MTPSAGLLASKKTGTGQDVLGGLGVSRESLISGLMLAAIVAVAALVTGFAFGANGERIATLFLIYLCAVLSISVFTGGSGITSIAFTAIGLANPPASGSPVSASTMPGASFDS